MGRLLIQRLSQSVFLVLAVVSVVFLTTFVIGDPARAMLPPETPRDAYLKFRHEMGFDRPIPVQYVDFLGDVIRGDFGDSWWQRAPALPIALRPVPATLLLGITAMGFAIAVGLPLGIVGSLRPGSWFDRFAVLISLIGLSLPSIWVGLMVVLIFSVKLGWLPTSGYGSVSHLVLPAVTLGLLPLGRIAQMTRATMIDELAKQYITTAKAKGLTHRRVTIGHAFRNVIIPIITVAGWEFVLTVSGYTIIVESVFGWPGVGFTLYNAILLRDMPLIAATAFVVAILVVAINFIIDIVYGLANPLVQYR